MSVAAIIPTIPGRERLLAEAVASVRAQTHPCGLEVELDEHLDGPAVARNAAAERSTSEWLAFLDDDDLWLPHHVATLLDHSEGADVVYPSCELVGEHNGLDVNLDFDPERLQWGNYIPITALVRRSAFEHVGGFDPAEKLEDWGLWLRLLWAGARFRHVPVVTWQYRWHGAQRTFA